MHLTIPLLIAASAPVAQFADFSEISVRVTEARGVTLADLNGDGRPDLIAGSGATGVVRLWLSGGGTAPFGSTRTLDPVAAPIRDIQAADLDRDGDVDLCLVTDGPAVTWLENLGGGAFAPEIPIFAAGAVLPSATARIRLVDMDGDGWIDILTCLDRSGVGAPSMVAVCQNAGAGAFSTSVPIQVMGIVTDMDAGDFDSDGDPDIAIVGGGSGQWFRNDGGQTFTAQGALSTTGAPLDDGRITAIDFDVDGDLDVIATFTEEFATDYVLFEGDGAGTFASGVTVRNRPRRILEFELGDFDGDGAVDLIESVEGPTSYLVLVTGVLGGGFAPGASEQFERSNCHSLAVGDRDLDGLPELVFGTDLGEVVSREEDPAVPGPDFSLPYVEATQTGFSPNQFFAADLNGDGSQGVAMVDRNRTRFHWWPTDGQGGYGDRRTVYHYDGQAEYPLLLDFDGDGDVDIVRRRNSVDLPTWLPNDGSGTFGPVVPLLSVRSFGFYLPILADLNGDGRVDWLVMGISGQSETQWQENLGGSAFGPLQPIGLTVPSSSNTLAIDIDSDGDLDLVHQALQGPSGPARWIGYLNDGVGTFGPPQTIGDLAAGPSANWASDLLVGDFNGDGHPDLLRKTRSNIIVFPFQSQLSVSLGMQGAQFAPEIVVDSPAEFLFQISVGDLEGDGFDDIVVDGTFLPSNPKGVLHYRSRGNGTFEPRRTLILDPGQLLDLAVGDRDGDGDDDVYLARVDGGAVGFIESLAVGNIGVPFCDGAVPNSTGLPGELNAAGSALLSHPNLRLTASSLPPQVFGIFGTSQTTTAVIAPNSIGLLCLGGSVGRFTAPGQIVQADGAGTFSIDVLTNALPTPTGQTSALPGSTWHFQAWHRDSQAGVGTSNFSRAVSVTFL